MLKEYIMYATEMWFKHDSKFMCNSYKKHGILKFHTIIVLNLVSTNKSNIANSHDNCFVLMIGIFL